MQLKQIGGTETAWYSWISSVSAMWCYQIPSDRQNEAKAPKIKGCAINPTMQLQTDYRGAFPFLHSVVLHVFCVTLRCGGSGLKRRRDDRLVRSPHAEVRDIRDGSANVRLSSVADYYRSNGPTTGHANIATWRTSREVFNVVLQPETNATPKTNLDGRLMTLCQRWTTRQADTQVVYRSELDSHAANLPPKRIIGSLPASIKAANRLMRNQCCPQIKLTISNDQFVDRCGGSFCDWNNDMRSVV